MVSLLEPSIIIPMRYKLPGLTIRLGTLNRFLKEMGIEKVEPQGSLKVARNRLPSETEVVVLTPRLE